MPLRRGGIWNLAQISQALAKHSNLYRYSREILEYRLHMTAKWHPCITTLVNILISVDIFSMLCMCNIYVVHSCLADHDWFFLINILLQEY